MGMEKFDKLKGIEIGVLGYNHSHPKTFHMDYPNGPGCWLMLLVKTPAIFDISNKRYDVKPHTFFIISPDTRLFYKAKNQEYTDDWCYFGMNEDSRKIIEEMGITLNEPHQLEDSDEISSIIHFITFEHYSADLFHKEIERQYINILFFKLSRIIKTNVHQSSAVFATKNDKLTYLRSRIFFDPTFFKNVNEMADFINISRSGFQHLYKNTFGTNVMSDVISSRIEFSKRLLKTTDLTLEEISEKIGYKSEYAFMRQFKELTGKTPTQYRKGDNWLQNSYEG